MKRMIKYPYGLYGQEEQEELETYLQQTFSGLQKCCRVIAPPERAKIKVMEPLQTCHETGGSNLDENNCIPAGIYEVGELQGAFPLGNSHTLTLRRLNEGIELLVIAGYGSTNTIDWRGTAKYD